MINIQKFVDKIQSNANKINQQEAYATGLNPAILRAYAKPAPDNRIISPSVMTAISLYKGYGANPGNIKYSGEVYESTLKEIYDRNDEPLISANEFEQGCRHGGMYEIHWFDSEGPNFELIPYVQGLPIWSNDIRPKLLAFVWYRKIDDMEYVDYFNESTVGKYALDKNVWTLLSEEQHGYGVVPVNCGPFQAEWKNLFDQALTLIDLKDKLLSQDVADEAERFNSAILVLRKRLSSEVDDSGLTDADKVKLWRIIDGAEDPSNEGAFITRDIPTTFIEFAVRIIEQDIVKALQIIDAYDQNFAGASGEAQKWRLLPMMYRFNSIKPYFVKFLQNRIKMICGHVLINKPWDDIDIVMTADLPINQSDLIKSALELSALTSKETALRYLPTSILPDGVESELEKIEESKPKMDVGSVVEDSNDTEDNADKSDEEL